MSSPVVIRSACQHIGGRHGTLLPIPCGDVQAVTCIPSIHARTCSTSALSTRRWGGILIASVPFYERRTPRGTPSHLESLAAANVACVTRDSREITIIIGILYMWPQRRVFQV